MAVRKPKRNVSTRYWYVASYRALGDRRGLLEPRRGGRVVVIDLETLDELTNAKDATIRLYAKEGDRLLACGPSLDEIAVLSVVAVETLEWRDRLTVEVREGAIKTGEVQVVKMARAA